MIEDILSPRAVMVDIAARSKKQVLQDIAVQLAPFAGCEAHEVFDALWARERLATTGIGHGIAIPHGKLKGVGEVQGFFARLDVPVAFEAVDDKPVDMIFVLLSPETAAADHLAALAAISTLLRDNDLCMDLRRAESATAIYDLLVGCEAAAIVAA
jgi:PTS system nitrogen regulatory IIA component